MSKYTTEVRFICEDYAGLTESGSYGTIESVIDRARPKLFDFYYPLYDPSYKRVLETKIIKHYYFREIGMETVGLFKFFLERKLNEIMPLYNKLYESELMVVNPLYSVELTTTHEGNGKKDIDSTLHNSGSDVSANSGKITKESNVITHDESRDETSNEGTASSNTKNTGKDTTTEKDTRNIESWDYFNDTPQGGISGLENLNYLTNARKTTSKVANANTGGALTTEVEHGHTISNSGSSKDSGYIERQGDGTRTERDEQEDNRSTTITKNTTVDNNVEVNTTDEYIQRVTGFSGVDQNKLLKEYRENLLNIDMMIVNELSGLFMNLW